ncbi:MAG: hypothetical protein LBR66_07485, partial [Candidatus Symbiothrix sp.]|nr:hypothetical protein [Candidatus Symbiothrix sp.]
MKHKILFSFLACTLAGVGAVAQVNIGTLDDPHRAAILHLRTTSEVGKSDSLGVKIPKVALPDTAKLHLGGAETCNLDVDETAAGMLVFNITDDPCGGLTPCLYVWDGASWLVMGCEIRISSVPAAPTANAQTFCGSPTVADLVATGEPCATFNWYEVSEGGSPLAGSTGLTTKTYYVSQTTASGESERT